MKALVLSVGGLNPSYLGCYGNDWVDTPHLDRLASESIVFDEHYADCPDLAGARRSWRTGCYLLPPALGGPGIASPGCVPPDLIRLLREQRIHCVLVQGPCQKSLFDFSTDWDRVCTVSKAHAEDTISVMLETAQMEISKLRSSEKWFLWIDAGAIFDPIPRFADVENDESFREMQEGYAEVVMRLDAQLGSFLRELKQGNPLDDLLIAITADRGVALGEHGVVGAHRPWLHEELVHVPLLMRLPQGVEGGRRVLALTQAVDLMPTVLEYFQVPAAPVHGQSLWPLMRGQERQVRPYACAGLENGAAAEWRLQTPHWALLLPIRVGPDDPPRSPQLYVKPDDRQEVNDLHQKQPDLAEKLEQVLHDFVAATQGPGPLAIPPLPLDDALDTSNPGHGPEF